MLMASMRVRSFVLVTHVWKVNAYIPYFNMAKNIVFEGWLTKSPPTKRIWRAKWRKRWFALRQSGELPGQYFMDYYADQNCRRKKGTIDLDLCEQVDAGLHMNKSGSGSPRLRGSVFTIRTSSRTYHLEADCEADMEKWVDTICRVCGLRATEEPPIVLATYIAPNSEQPPIERQPTAADSAGPYIPISECITGSRDPKRAFSFDTGDLVPGRVLNKRKPAQMYTSQPQIRVIGADFSENDSNLSEDESKSLNNSQSNIGDWSVAKTFTKLSISPKNNGVITDGPPVPPRPPKTLTRGKDYQREPFYGPKLQEPMETENMIKSPNVRQNRPTTAYTGARNKMYSTARFGVCHTTHVYDDDEMVINPPYCNLWILPPEVDRALKPRPSQVHTYGRHSRFPRQNEMKSDVLQYLDLDLQSCTPSSDKDDNILKETKVNEAHGTSLSVDATSNYKTVDFVKTVAFSDFLKTRQEAAQKTAI